MDQVVSRPARHECIDAVGLLAHRELNLLGLAFDRIWPVEEAPNFSELLRTIDKADERLQRAYSRPRESRDN